MTVELRVLRGARAGESERFAKSVILIGRHPLCDFRFDAHQDLDVSARHAEIRAVDGAYVLHDQNSTNGTYVNGTRIPEARALRDGDVVSFGAGGPQLEVRILENGTTAPASDTSPARRGVREPAARVAPARERPPRGEPSTGERIAQAVREHTRVLRIAIGALAAVLVVGVAATYWVGRQAVARRDVELEQLRRTNDSLTRVYGEHLASLAGHLVGLDSALAAAQMESARLQAALRSARREASGSADDIAQQLSRNEARRTAMLTAAQVDYSTIAQRDGPAVTLVAVEWADGRAFSGSGFALTTDGQIVTNRHLVTDSLARAPQRIAVIFSDTKAWLPAHVVRASATADLALLQLDAPGPFPAVAGVRESSAVPVGSPVVVIGYPLGMDTPMEGSGTRITARSTLTGGTLSKSLPDVQQIDSYASEGSSGSPVFDLNGLVIGVVYGGARESSGRIVYAVPSDKLAALREPAR